MQYHQIPEKFDAIQFTGGQENAHEVIQWLKAHDFRGARWVPNLETDAREFIELRGRENVCPEHWIVIGERSGLELFTTEYFKKMYAPVMRDDINEAETVESFRNIAELVETAVEQTTAAITKYANEINSRLSSMQASSSASDSEA